MGIDLNKKIYSAPILPKAEGKIVGMPAIFFIPAVFIVFILFILTINFFVHKKNSSPITTISFQKNTAGFSPVGQPEGVVSINKNKEDSDPLADVGCLQYDYENGIEKFTGVGALNINVNNFEMIKLRMFSKESRTFAMSVDEIEGGSVYLFIFDLQGGKWQDVIAKPENFILGRGYNDKNGKLDVDDLNSRIVIADLSGQKGIIGQNLFRISRLEIIRIK